MANLLIKLCLMPLAALGLPTRWLAFDAPDAPWPVQPPATAIGTLLFFLIGGLLLTLACARWWRRGATARAGSPVADGRERARE